MQSIIKTMEMDIKELTEKYRERFEAFYHTEGNEYRQKRKQEEKNGRNCKLS